MPWRLLPLLAALIGGALAAPALACSVTADYVRPSNFELVQIADAIVVATPEGPASGSDHGLTFRVVTAIKGTPPARVTLGMAALGRTTPSDLADLSGSHPQGYAGPCNRTSFAQDGRYLLFLEQAADGNWYQSGYPFSRVNEDYAGEDTAWMRAVRRYLLLQQSLTPMEQLAALARMAESGRDGGGVTLAAAERADIREHLSSISPWKPTAWLLDLHDRIERGEPLPFGSRPDAANREGGDADRLTSFVAGESLPAASAGAERERMLILGALTEGDHPDALPLFERLSAAPAIGPRLRGLILRFLARNGQYPRAYQWIETRLMVELTRLGYSDARLLLSEVNRLQWGENRQEGNQRWRSDPHAVATWPELALALYWYQVHAFGADPIQYRDAVGAIPVTDYRARPELTVALAAAFDTNVKNWAIAELARPPDPWVPGADDEQDPAFLPLRVLATMWSSETIAELTRAYCQGGARRRLAVLALGQWGHSLYWELLAAMAGVPRLSADEKSWLVQAAIEMTARDVRESRRRPFVLPADQREWLLIRLVRGERMGVAPLACRG